MKPKIQPGDKFHYLTVIELSHRDYRWRLHYKCQCRCGTIKTVQGTLLRAGNTKSCGCWAKESARSRALPHGRASKNLVLAGYRHKAKKAGVPFNLTRDQFDRITKLPCFYCGTPPSNVCKSAHGTGDCAYSGLDKIRPKSGYTVNNVVPCCHACNFAKSNRAQGEFIQWIKRVHDHLLKTAMAEQWG